MKTNTHQHKIKVILLFIFSIILLSCTNKDSDKLVIYTYDSFASEWGPAPIVIPEFEKQTGIKVELVVVGDSGQLVSRAISEKKSPKADILLGLDNNLLFKVKESKILCAYKSQNSKNIIEQFIFDPDWLITPYDWSSFTIMWDSEKLQNPPKSLEDLTKKEYEKKLVLMDPRTSTPGLGFIAWTKAVYGEGFADYWKRLRPSILTMSASWGTGYGLFTKGEVPLALSYSTSAAYHAEYETAGRFRALQFPEGHAYQIEGAGIVNNCKHKKEAEAFIDFMLTKEFQSAIPNTNWMYPVCKDIELSKCYEYSEIPSKLLSSSTSNFDNDTKIVLDILAE